MSYIDTFLFSCYYAMSFFIIDHMFAHSSGVGGQQMSSLGSNPNPQTKYQDHPGGDSLSEFVDIVFQERNNNQTNVSIRCVIYDIVCSFV